MTSECTDLTRVRLNSVRLRVVDDSVADASPASVRAGRRAARRDRRRASARSESNKPPRTQRTRTRHFRAHCCARPRWFIGSRCRTNNTQKSHRGFCLLPPHTASSSTRRFEASGKRLPPHHKRRHTHHEFVWHASAPDRCPRHSPHRRRRRRRLGKRHCSAVCICIARRQTPVARRQATVARTGTPCHRAQSLAHTHTHTHTLSLSPNCAARRRRAVAAECTPKPTVNKSQM